MKNKIFFLIFILAVSCAAVGNSAETSIVAGPPGVPSEQSAVVPSQLLQAKLNQARALLSELNDLLKSGEQSIAGLKNKKEQVKQTKVSLKERDRAVESLEKDIRKMRDQINNLDKDLAVKAKKTEQYSRMRSEIDETEKERLAFDAKANEAGVKLAALQNNLAELKAKYAELNKQNDETTKQYRAMENAKAVLEREKERRLEALARAEETVAEAEKAEKEKLLLQNRLAELEQNIAPLREKISAKSEIESEIEKEGKLIADTEQEIKREEKACAAAAKEISRLTEKIKQSEDAIRSAGRKGDEQRLQSQLATLKKEREEAESRLKQIGARLAENQESITALTNNLAGIEKAAGEKASLERLNLEAEIENERQKIADAEREIEIGQKKLEDTEKMTGALNKQLKQAQKTERARAEKEDAAVRLQAQLLRIKKESVQAENEFRKVQSKLREKEQAVSDLTNALARIQGENGRQEEALPERIRIENEIKSETESLSATEQEVKLTEKKLEEAEKTIEDLKDQLTALEKTRCRADKGEDDAACLQAQLAQIRKQRTEAASRLEQVEGELQTVQKSAVDMANTLANDKNLIKIREEKNASIRISLERELENERKMLAAVEQDTANAGESMGEAEGKTAALKKELKEAEASSRAGSRSEERLQNLRADLEKIRQKRTDAASRLKQMEVEIQQGRQAVSGLTNMIADANRREESNRETIENIAVLTAEISSETDILKEVAKSLEDKESRLEAVKKEKTRLNVELLQLQEQASKDDQIAGKWSDIKRQLAEQKKLRAQIEGSMDNVNKEQDAIAKGVVQLKITLDEARKKTKQVEDDFKMLSVAESELSGEKALLQKSAQLASAKEKIVKQLNEEKTDLQNKINEAETVLAERQLRLKELEEKRVQAEDLKHARAVSDKKYIALAKAEKEQKRQNKELQTQLRDVDRQSETLSRKIGKYTEESSAAIPSMVADENAGKDALAVEQDILAKARGQQPAEGDIGTKSAGEKEAPGKTKTSSSRSKKNRIAEAEAHYVAGIQKWDEDDIEGAIAEFKRTIDLNPDAASAYYNAALGCLKLGNKEEACQYAYQAGECYLRINNPTQAARMAVLLMKIDDKSPLLPKLRSRIAAATR